MRRRRAQLVIATASAAGLAALLLCLPACGPSPAGSGISLAWYGYALLFFFGSALLGFVSVLAGAGGGVLFVPLLAGFTPIHLDFIRGAGVLVALVSAQGAGPRLLRGGLASIRLALPAGIVASVFAVAGVHLGTLLPANAMQILLGVVITIVALLMLIRPSERQATHDVTPCPRHSVERAHPGDDGESQQVWRSRNLGYGLACFSVTGLVSGMFGMGSGWASVPVLNLVMGAPLKVAVATSLLVLTANTSAAAWVYLHQGALLPLLVVPSVAGVLLGARLASRVLPNTRPAVIRRIVIAMMLLAGIRSLLKGSGIWA